MNESAGDASRVLANIGALPVSQRWSTLVTRMAAGDTGALSAFYDDANHYVHAIAMRILRNPDDAEEVTLDVFQQAWRLAASYNPDRCAVPSWLAMMTRSRALDCWRARQARLRLLGPAPPEAVESVSPASGPETLLAATEEQQRVQRAMSALPEEQRCMLSLAFWGGLSHSEVAERTGVPLGTVKTRIRLGMLKLREELEHADRAR